MSAQVNNLHPWSNLSDCPAEPLNRVHASNTPALITNIHTKFYINKTENVSQIHSLHRRISHVHVHNKNKKNKRTKGTAPIQKH